MSNDANTLEQVQQMLAQLAKEDTATVRTLAAAQLDDLTTRSVFLLATLQHLQGRGIKLDPGVKAFSTMLQHLAAGPSNPLGIVLQPEALNAMRMIDTLLHPENYQAATPPRQEKTNLPEQTLPAETIANIPKRPHSTVTPLFGGSKRIH